MPIANGAETFWSASGSLLSVFGEWLAVVLTILGNHLALVAWVLFFLFVVRWADLRAVLRAGAWPVVLLLTGLFCLVWALTSQQTSWPELWQTVMLADPKAASTRVLEKFVFGGFWLGVAWVCGLLQDYWGFVPAEVKIVSPVVTSDTTSHGH